MVELWFAAGCGTEIVKCCRQIECIEVSDTVLRTKESVQKCHIKRV